MIKVFIIDDSAVVRKVLTEIFSSVIGIKVIGSAADPYIAARKLANQLPDVITLDIEMPKMDGLTFLKKVMSQKPVPVVVISSLTDRSSKVGLEALKAGAVEIITKPKLGSQEELADSKIIIIDAVKAAAMSKVKRQKTLDIKASPKHSADVILAKPKNRPSFNTRDKIIAIGASTGGTEAIANILRNIDKKTSGIVIVQHMPELFTKSFAERLNHECNIEVKEAEDGDEIVRGRALIAPGNMHMMISRCGNKYYTKIQSGELVNRHRPSVDVLFRSVAREAGKNAIGVLLTGMGDDGAKGLLEMKKNSAKTIAQNEESCVVYGMPREAVKLDAVDIVADLTEIPDLIENII